MLLTFWVSVASRLFISLCGVVSLFGSIAFGIGFDADDFIVTRSLTNRIAVYDSDFSFKGNLDSSFMEPTGLDFSRNGFVVAGSYSAHEIRVYDSNGVIVGGFSSPELGPTLDLKAAVDGSFLVGMEGYGLLRFSANGDILHQYHGFRTEAVAVLPGDRVWSSGIFEPVREFDIDTGTSGGTFGHSSTTSMFYSSVSDTILLCDYVNETVQEVDRSGVSVREFLAPGIVNPSGVTRGPGGDVFVTMGTSDSVFRWKDDGTFVEEIQLESIGDTAYNIVWAGNFIPEPSSMFLVLSTAMCGVAATRRRGLVAIA